MLEAARVSEVSLPVIDIEDLSSPRSSDRQAVGSRAADGLPAQRIFLYQ
jgi:hypothetical protein